MHDPFVRSSIHAGNVIERLADLGKHSELGGKMNDVEQVGV